MNNQKILIIDDDPDYILSTKAILKNEGYKVITATDGVQGLEKARSEKPDLILLDVMLPDADGFSICRELKENLETLNVPIIILTSIGKHKGKSYSDVIAYCHKADDFLEKPVTKDELLTSIRYLLKEKKVNHPDKKKKILIVDPDKDFVSGLEKVLNDHFEVFTAESGIEAKKIALAFFPDIVILEIILPDTDGYSVCYDLKKNPKTSHLKVIIVSKIENKLSETGYASQIAAKHRADLYLAKPVEPLLILQKINDFLEENKNG